MGILQRLLDMWRRHEARPVRQERNEASTFDTGLVLHAARRYDEALQSFDRALATGDVRALSMRGCCLQALGRHGEAIDAFTLAIESEPADCNCFYLRAQSHHAMGLRDEAIADIQAAIRLAERDTSIVREYNDEAAAMGWRTAEALYRDRFSTWELEAHFTATDPQWLRERRESRARSGRSTDH